MISLLLTVHIIALTSSIIATTVMMIMVLLARQAPKLARQINLAVTTLGIAIGAMLLVQNPIGAHCLELTLYVIIFSVTYRYISVRSTQLSAAH